MPYEIFSVVAGSAGLLAFLISTIEKLVQVVYNIKRAKSILLCYLHDFEATRDRVIAWERKWLRYSPEMLWTEKGAETIKEQWDNMHEILEQSKSLVEGRSHNLYDWDHPEATKWTQFLKDVREELHVGSSQKGSSRSRVQQSPNVLQRVALVLGREKLLDDHLKRLRSSISNLESRSNTLYSQAHFFDQWDYPHTARDLEEAEIGRTRAENIKKMMSNVFDQLHRDRIVHYALVMVLPDDIRQCSVIASEVLHINLLRSEVEPCPSLACARFNFRFSPDRNSEYSARKLLEGIHSSRNSERTHLSEDLKAFLIRMSADALNSHYAAGTLLSRGKAALSLAVWTAFTWNTGWMCGLCSCGLRMTKDEVRTVGPPAFWKKCHNSQPILCSVGESEGRCHLLMGILLAELALLRPVYFSRDDLHGKHFRVREDPGNTVCLTREDLKNRVWDETVSHDYPSAMEYCFDLDDIQTLRTNSQLKLEDKLRLYNTKVLQPLIRYYKSIEEHCGNLQFHFSWAERWTFLWHDSRA